MAADRGRVDSLAEFRRAVVDVEGVHHLARARVHFCRHNFVVVRNDAGGNETNGGPFAGRGPSLLEQTEVCRIHYRRRGYCARPAWLPVVATGAGVSTGVLGETYR